MTRRIAIGLAPLALVVAIAFGAAGCAHHRAEPWSRGDTAGETAASALRVALASARSKSPTWSPALRPLDDAPWLAPLPSTPLRLAQLRARAGDPAAFDRDAAALLAALLDRGHRNILLATAGLASADELARLLHPALITLAARERAHLAACTTAGDRRAWVDRLRARLPVDPDGAWRYARIAATLPFSPFIWGWMGYHILTEERGAIAHDFADTILFDPPRADDDLIADRIASGNVAGLAPTDLVAYYAPVIVQERPASPAYPDHLDRVGTASIVSGDDGEPLSVVAADAPEIYAATGEAFVGGAWLTQLTYSYWYPGRPALAGLADPEAGHIDGWVVRMTLGRDLRPLIVETVEACGCYHRTFPARRLLDDAGDATSLVRGQFMKIDAFAPESSGAFDPLRPHPVVFARAGSHQILAVTFDASAPRARDKADEQDVVPYRLQPAERLHELPWNGRAASFYGPDGLVRGADRIETILLFPTGLYHAGTPRASELRLLHFDQYDYNDPTLLDTLLRIRRDAPL